MNTASFSTHANAIEPLFKIKSTSFAAKNESAIELRFY